MSENQKRGESTVRPDSAEPGETLDEKGHRGESGERSDHRPEPKPHRGDDAQAR